MYRSLNSRKMANRLHLCHATTLSLQDSYKKLEEARLSLKESAHTLKDLYNDLLLLAKKENLADLGDSGDEDDDDDSYMFKPCPGIFSPSSPSPNRGGVPSPPLHEIYEEEIFGGEEEEEENSVFL